MASIQSNVTAATRVAHQFREASQPIASACALSVQQADRTMLNGNQEAKRINHQAQALVQHFHLCLDQDLAHIQQVAQAFERQDKQLSQRYEGMTP